jgi:hypothetical protein
VSYWNRVHGAEARRLLNPAVVTGSSVQGIPGSRSMTLWCKFGRHSVSPHRIENEGIYFSRCRDCGVDLIARVSETRWTVVPEGYAVRWRSPPNPVCIEKAERNRFIEVVEDLAVARFRPLPVAEDLEFEWEDRQRSLPPGTGSHHSAD